MWVLAGMCFNYNKTSNNPHKKSGQSQSGHHSDLTSKNMSAGEQELLKRDRIVSMTVTYILYTSFLYENQ